MAPPESTPATLFVQDLIDLSDAELAQFMEEHRLPNGNFELPVDGWDKLSKEGRNNLAQRLKAQERVFAQNRTVHSCPLDLDQLDARLCEVTSDNITSRDLPRIIERSRSPTPFVDFEADARDRETEAHHDMVNNGGRPLYPIGLLNQVFTNLEDHRDMLRPWQDPSDPKFWKVFQRQWERWQNFRKWQRDNRRLQDDDGGFPAYVEWMKREAKRDYTENGYAKWLAETEADPSYFDSGWERRQWERQRQRHYNREHGCDGFSDYVEAVRRRLARHGFTRPFHLKDDPKQQDKLTTWIEYLNFEYWWLDKYTKSIERLKPDHDKAWQELVDSNILKPHETKEYVRTIDCAKQHEAEKEQARKAVQAATSEAEKVYAMTQLDPHRLNIPRLERRRMLRAATAELYAAKDRLKMLKRRSDLIINFVRGTFNYERAKKDTARQNNLLPWVLEQVPLVEAELMQTGTTNAESDKSKSRKRKVTSSDGLTKQYSKRRKQYHGDINLLSDGSTAVQAEGAQPGASFAINDDRPQRDEARGPRARQSLAKCSLRSIDTPQTLCQGPRRSTRIAARQNQSSPPLAPPSRQQLHLRSQARSARIPNPLVSTDGADPSVSSWGGTKNGNRRDASNRRGVSKTCRRSRKRAV